MLNQLLVFIGKIITGVDARDLFCLAQIILALIKERTINLTKICLHCHYTSVRSEAHYRRLQRFIARCPITQGQVASIILGFFEESILLDMDRTNWAFGSFEINILVLSAIYKGYSFPLFWTLWLHKVCSPSEDRIDLVKTFIQAFGAHPIKALLMDLEFIAPPVA